jgi:dolichyldiphosphatase
MDLTQISLTYVQYPIDGGLFAKGMAYMSLMPVFLVVSFITLILFKRDLQTIVFFMGQMSNEILNFILKRLIAQERPTRNWRRIDGLGHLGKGYGMPSNHAQFMTFFVTYFIFCLLFR